MSEAVKKLLNEFHQSSIAEQAEFLDSANVLLDSPPGYTSEADPDFEDVLNRRLQEHLSGKDPGIPAEEVHAAMRLKYGKRS